MWRSCESPKSFPWHRAGAANFQQVKEILLLWQDESLTCLFPVPPDSAARKTTYTFALGHQIHRELMDSFTPHPAATLYTRHNKGISPRITSTCSSKCYPALPKDGGTKESVQMVCSCCLQNTQLTWWHNMNPSPGKIPRHQIILGKFCVL